MQRLPLARQQLRVLELDVHRDGVLPEDRFLLCSDGLTRVVPADVITSWMKHPNIEEAVEGLIHATLEAGAPDNVTVVIAEAVGAQIATGAET